MSEPFLGNDPVLPSIARAMGDKTTEVFGFISSFIDSMGYSPSTREIADGVGLKSNMTANYHVHKLAAAGLIDYQPNCPRTIRLVGEAHV